jgi:hypothetical protein
VRDFPALTIQADRKVRVSIYLPAICWGNTWNGVYLGFNVKINGVQYNMGSSGKAITMAYGTRVSSVHNNTKILDPIAINVVQPGQDYTLQFSIKAKMSTGSARFIYDTDINKAGVWKGVALESARNLPAGTIPSSIKSIYTE